MVRLVSALLVLAYLFALVMSAGHLSEWYRLTLGSLPSWFAIGLATALEASAFLLSLLSNSILKESWWAKWGALVALGLVWVGNYMSMLRAADGVPAYEVFLSSLFVPVSTYVVAKVLGELQTANARGVKEVSRASEAFPLGKPEEGGSREASRETPEGPKAVFPLSPVQASPGASGEPLEASPVNPKVSSGETQEASPEASEISQVSEAPPLRAGPAVSWKPGSAGEVHLNGKASPNGYTRYLELLDTPRTLTELAELASVSKPAARKALKFLEEKGLVELHGGRWMRKEGGSEA